MEVRRYISPKMKRVHTCLCVDKCVNKCYRQSMEGGKTFPLEHPLSLITSDYRLSEREMTGPVLQLN